MRKWLFALLIGIFAIGCNSQPTEHVKKKQAREEKEPDPYVDNSEESDESNDPQKGYFDPLRDIKDVKKQHEEELQKEKETIDEMDNQSPPSDEEEE
jgi:hypothetical protein